MSSMAGLDPIAGMRALVADYGMGCSGPGLAACQVKPVMIGRLPAEWLVPPDAGDARLVYLHGGGWVAGSPASHRALAAELALGSGRPVLVPDYRLAPEHPFPAGLADAAAALGHAATHGPDGPGAAAGVALAGDSAGGNMAAVLALGLGPAVPALDRLLLISPFLAVAESPDGFAGPVDDPVVALAAMALVASLSCRLNGALEGSIKGFDCRKKRLGNLILVRQAGENFQMISVLRFALFGAPLPCNAQQTARHGPQSGATF